MWSTIAFSSVDTTNKKEEKKLRTSFTSLHCFYLGYNTAMVQSTLFLIWHKKSEDTLKPLSSFILSLKVAPIKKKKKESGEIKQE